MTCFMTHCGIKMPLIDRGPLSFIMIIHYLIKKPSVCQPRFTVQNPVLSNPITALWTLFMKDFSGILTGKKKSPIHFNSSTIDRLLPSCSVYYFCPTISTNIGWVAIQSHTNDCQTERQTNGRTERNINSRQSISNCFYGHSCISTFGHDDTPSLMRMRFPLKCSLHRVGLHFSLSVS